MNQAADMGARHATRAYRLPWPTSLALGVGVAIAYAVSGVGGLALARSHGNATAIWPPTGIAVAALFLAGARLWPAVFAGALAVNLWAGSTAAVAAGIAVGNTLEGVVAAALLARVGFDRRFRSPRDLYVFVALACVVAPVAAATVGALALPLGGELAWADAFPMWRVWWLGDATSALLLAPFLLVWARRGGAAAPTASGRGLEIGVFATLLAVTFALGADRAVVDPFARGAAQLVAFPLMIWSGLRFGARGATAATLGAVVIAVWRTSATITPAEDGLALAQMWFHLTVVGVSALVAATLSERERLAASLRDTEARFRSLVASAPVCIKELSLDGRILSINPAGVELFRAEDASGVVGRDYLGFLGDEEREACADALRAVARGETRVVELASGDGAFQSTFAPIHDDAGQVVRVVCHGLDLSHRKRAEEERLHLHRQLLDAQKLESLGLLAGGVAHDFNNLLLAIHGNAEIAASDPRDVASVRESLAAIELAATRATELCRSMLAFSGKGHFELATLDLEAELTALKGLLSATWPANVRLELELPRSGPVLVSADATQLRQLLMNLLTNAADAARARGGERRVRVALTVRDTGPSAYEPTRRSPAMAPGRFAVVEVEDDGVGMPPDVLARMFEPFFTTKGASRGLGLAATLGTVRGHKGAIAVRSRPGEGTRFEVALPASDAELAPTSAEGASREPTRAAPTVLVIDDEPLLLELARRMLSGAGYRVVTAASGEEGVELVRSGAADPALVLLDLTMPGLGGVETCQRLRDLRPGLRVVLSSGFDAEAQLTREE
ncbi:MAG: MASE1 domain-containing protein, partial [Myxococcales bacterium]|nr:MASE1 domain-containing protein [Myxococcales bacterium]